MLRSSAAIASRMLRLVVASSRQSILCHRAIAASPSSLKNKLAFPFFHPSLPPFQSPADQSRGYARGRPVISDDEDEDDNEDEDDSEDDEEFEDEFDPCDGDIEGEKNFYEKKKEGEENEEDHFADDDDGEIHRRRDDGEIHRRRK